MGSSGLKWDHDRIIRGCRLGDRAKYFVSWTIWSFATSHQKAIYRFILFGDDNPFLFVHCFLSKQKYAFDTTDHFQINGIINSIFEYDLPLMIPFTGETDCWVFRLSTASTIVIYSVVYLDGKKRNKH